MKKRIVFLLLPLVFLTGCVSWFHSCKTQECFPLCRITKEENRFLSMKNWESFKTFRPLPYVPSRIAFIDNIGHSVNMLSVQITEEIVKPWVEMDKDGKIALYYEFSADVKAVVKQRKCSVKEASDLVWKDWLSKPGGEKNCRDLVQVTPIILNMRMGNQITNAMIRIAPQIVQLLVDFRRQKEAFMREIKTRKGIIKVSAAAVPVGYNLGRLSFAVAYLSALKQEQSEQDKEIERFITGVEELGKGI